jgi:hypothetical protein
MAGNTSAGDKRRQAQFVNTGSPETAEDKLVNGQLLYSGQLGHYYDTYETLGVSQIGVLGMPASHRRYIYVQLDSGVTTLTRNALVWWKNMNTGVKDWIVTNDPTGRQNFPAGRSPIWPGAVGSGFFIQVKGPGRLRFISSPTSTPDTTGKFVVPSSTANKADSIATAPTGAQVGLTAGTYDAAAQECIVDLNLADTP